MSKSNKSNPFVLPLVVLVILGLVIGGMVALYNAVKPSDGDVFRRPVTLRKEPPPPLSAYKPAPAATLKIGRKLFQQHCVLCHGPQGAGDGPGARNLSPKPTPYLWGQFRHGNEFSDILRIITKGSPNRRSGMIAWNWMPEAQRKALAHYVLALSVKHAKRAQPAPRQKQPDTTKGAKPEPRSAQDQTTKSATTKRPQHPKK